MWLDRNKKVQAQGVSSEGTFYENFKNWGCQYNPSNAKQTFTFNFFNHYNENKLMVKVPTDALESGKKNAVSDIQPSKVCLDMFSPRDDEAGERLAQEAILKAKKEGLLMEAADIMEDAFNKSPALRQRYAERVRLWKCGISM